MRICGLWLHQRPTIFPLLAPIANDRFGQFTQVANCADEAMMSFINMKIALWKQHWKESVNIQKRGFVIKAL